MQIRPTGQPIPVSKVENDRREEVKKITPIGSQKIPDSFETGSSNQSSSQSNSSASAAPEKKAGQITGGILIKQMTQARLGNSGIKITNEVRENSGVKDFNDTQQDQAGATTPKVDTKGNPHTPGATTDYGPRVPDGAYTGDARSNMEKNKGALQDFFAQQNIDASSSGPDASDFGRGDGVDLGNGFNNGPQGPGDPMDNVNDQFARRDYLDGIGNAGNRLTSQMQNALQGSDGANMGHGNDMVSIDVPVFEEGKTAPTAPTATKKGDEVDKINVSQPTDSQKALEDLPVVGDDIAKGLKGTKQSAGNYMQRIEDAANSDPTTTPANKPTNSEPKDRYAHHDDGRYTRFDANGKTAEIKNADGSREYFAKDKDGQWVQVSKKEYDKRKNASTPNPENYVDSEALKKMNEMDGMLKNLGLDGIWNHQRGPNNQGKGPDYGPEGPGPVGVSVEDAAGSLLSQFGKEGLVGQPNQQNHEGSGPSNFGGLPGETVTDPQEGSNYHGTTRNEEVDVSVQTGIEENVDDNDDEEKRKLLKNPDFKAATKVPRFQ